MNIQEQIQKSEEEFDEKFLKRPYEEGIIYANGEEVKSWHRNSIKSILEGLVARNRKICEENVKTYGTDKWNSDLEEQTDYLLSK